MEAVHGKACLQVPSGRRVTRRQVEGKAESRQRRDFFPIPKECPYQAPGQLQPWQEVNLSRHSWLPWALL